MRPDLRVEVSDGTVVGYAESGDPAGPPILYLHGSPSSRLEAGLPGMGEVAEDLGLRVLTPDRPGMGLTAFRRYSVTDYPRLVRSFADALGLGRFRRDPNAMFSTVERIVGPADRDVLAGPGYREVLNRNMGEAFRQGARGPAYDLTLEARPWGVPFDSIEVPIEIWHGEDDRVVSVEQVRTLARALPLVTEHHVPGEGHFSVIARHAGEILQSVMAP